MKIKKILAMILIGFSATSWAADNMIYIDQTGDGATINVTQDGAGNRVRGVQGIGTGDTTPAKMNGDNMSITINQKGSGNILNFGVNNTTANGGSPSTYRYEVIGNNAVATINSNSDGQNASASNQVDVQQTGNYAMLNLTLLGSTNTFNAVTSGGANNAIDASINANNTNVTINQTGGGGNTTTLNMTGNNGTVSVTTTGASNATNITQSGGGSAGHSATINLNGSGNGTTVVQSGSVDHVLSYTMAGSTNVANFSQTGSNSSVINYNGSGTGNTISIISK